jgi:hypothetical protein
MAAGLKDCSRFALRLDAPVARSVSLLTATGLAGLALVSLTITFLG